MPKHNALKIKNNMYMCATQTLLSSPQVFPAKVVTQVQLLANMTANMTAPLDTFADIIKEVNITGMRADLTHIDDFFRNAPTPSLLKQIMDDLNTALKVTLSNTLDALKSDIDSTTNNSALHKLMQNIEVLRVLSTAQMNATLGAYDTAIQDIKAE